MHTTFFRFFFDVRAASLQAATKRGVCGVGVHAAYDFTDTRRTHALLDGQHLVGGRLRVHCDKTRGVGGVKMHGAHKLTEDVQKFRRY